MRCRISANDDRQSANKAGVDARMTFRHNNLMPTPKSPKASMPSGALPMLILRVLQSNACHGYAIAQRIRILSHEVLGVEEGLLYPTLQRMLLKGWVTAKWGISETNRKVRFYELTKKGREELKGEVSDFHRYTQAIQDVLRTADGGSHQ